MCGFIDAYVKKAIWQYIDVAVKALKITSFTEEATGEFQHEAQHHGSLRHQNIVTLYGICIEPGHYCMIMELMPGGSLYNLLHSKNDLLWMRRFSIAEQIAIGLNYLHEQNIIHSDLKSLNVLLDGSNAKLTDFGLSKIKTETKSTTMAHNVSGSLLWTAPELFKRRGKHTELTDTYSLGMILWELASRKLPFEDSGGNQDLVRQWVLQEERDEIPEETPSDFAELIKYCWAQKPENRPQTVSLIVQQMKEIIELQQEKLSPKSWHFDPNLERSKAAQVKGYELIPAEGEDFQKVLKQYQHHPVPGYEVFSVEVIYNPAMNRIFSQNLQMLQQQEGNPIFAPKFIEESPTTQEKNWRAKIRRLWETMAAPYTDSDYPQVKLLPLWHGTSPAALDSIFKTGYANLATTDCGFFGKGLYSAYEAEYSWRCYSGGMLILNWVASFSAYPVIDGDMPKLKAFGNYQNYDAHFIPVVPDDPHKVPTTSIYYPCTPNQQHQYTEVVVFQKTQCLPRYLVKLQATLLQNPSIKLLNEQIEIIKKLQQNLLETTTVDAISKAATELLDITNKMQDSNVSELSKETKNWQEFVLLMTNVTLGISTKSEVKKSIDIMIQVVDIAAWLFGVIELDSKLSSNKETINFICKNVHNAAKELFVTKSVELQIAIELQKKIYAAIEKAELRITTQLQNLEQSINYTPTDKANDKSPPEDYDCQKLPLLASATKKFNNIDFSDVFNLQKKYIEQLPGLYDAQKVTAERQIRSLTLQEKLTKYKIEHRQKPTDLRSQLTSRSASTTSRSSSQQEASNNAATKIQALWRGNIGRKQAFLMQKKLQRALEVSKESVKYQNGIFKKQTKKILELEAQLKNIDSQQYALYKQEIKRKGHDELLEALSRIKKEQLLVLSLIENIETRPQTHLTLKEKWENVTTIEKRLMSQILLFDKQIMFLMFLMNKLDDFSLSLKREKIGYMYATKIQALWHGYTVRKNLFSRQEKLIECVAIKKAEIEEISKIYAEQTKKIPKLEAQFKSLNLQEYALYEQQIEKREQGNIQEALLRMRKEQLFALSLIENIETKPQTILTLKEKEKTLEKIIDGTLTHQIFLFDKQVSFLTEKIFSLSFKELPRFLKHIGWGEQDEAEEMLKVNPNLAIISGDFTDCAKREFNQATGLQYAIWALDYHMWTMLKKYMPTEEIKTQLLKLDNEGIDVKEPKANSYTKTKQVSWQKLIDSLQMYIDNHEAWSIEQCRDHWCQQVGGAQLTLPAHVIQEYSRKDRPFYPCPEFNEMVLPRHEDWTVDGWYRSQQCGKLGVAFAWWRGWHKQRSMIGNMKPFGGEGTSDQYAMVSLFEVRIKQRTQLISSVTLGAKPTPKP